MTWDDIFPIRSPPPPVNSYPEPFGKDLEHETVITHIVEFTQIQQEMAAEAGEATSIFLSGAVWYRCGHFAGRDSTPDDATEAPNIAG